ncbi:MAG: hypothetical protein IH946_04500 [Bacteroidetes bacterium]|nr:hypothetical protein [Bacteroidota bacterium]
MGLTMAMVTVLLIVIPYFLINSSTSGSGGTDLPLGFFVFAEVLGLIFFGNEIYTNLNIIVISNDSISFKNLILPISSEYKLNELDGFIDQIQHSRAGKFDIIFLKKQDKRIRKISSFYYSNYPEIKEYLKSRFKYIGYERFKYFG